MNRAQRRKLLRDGFGGDISRNKHTIPFQAPLKTDEQPDFSDVPLVTVCHSIRLLIDELRSRGYPVYDFYHKENPVQNIQIIRDKVYFMAAEEAVADGKAQAESEQD